jgi:hypothetical protein
MPTCDPPDTPKTSPNNVDEFDRLIQLEVCSVHKAGCVWLNSEG